MRNLSLSHEEIELIEKALNFTYNRTLDAVNATNGIISIEARKELTDSANKYAELANSIANGNKDV